MTLFQALAYFTREALLNLLRGWKVSVLAILTITVSLFLTGIFLLVSNNLRNVIEGWRSESKVVVYLRGDVEEAALSDLETSLRQSPGTEDVTAIDTETARERFQQAFPSMADLLEGWGENPLPRSFEVRLNPSRLVDRELETWLDTLRQHPSVMMVDDDRDWLDQLEAVVLVLQGLALMVGGILLATAIFTISSVIRLTAYLYRDEIAVMRLVGATEFFIRGPFYLEGFLQGMGGGALALSGLFATYSLANSRPGSLLTSVLASEFLPWSQVLGLVGLGGLAGLIGAVSSLRRETLQPTKAEDDPDWSPEEN